MISVHDGGPVGSLGELARFRDGFRRCLACWGDALFELADAVLSTDGPVSSLVRLCLEPEFQRGHGSLYQGLSAGRVDAAPAAGVACDEPPAKLAIGVRGRRVHGGTL